MGSRKRMSQLRLSFPMGPDIHPPGDSMKQSSRCFSLAALLNRRKHPWRFCRRWWCLYPEGYKPLRLLLFGDRTVLWRSDFRGYWPRRWGGNCPWLISAYHLVASPSMSNTRDAKTPRSPDIGLCRRRRATAEIWRQGNTAIFNMITNCKLHNFLELFELLELLPDM